MSSSDDRIQALESKLELLTLELARVRAEQQIAKLHNIYGYYLDCGLYREVIDLLADDCRVHLLRGIFKGKAGARRLFLDLFEKNFSAGIAGPAYGLLREHLQMQPVVTVADEGMTAKGRFRSLSVFGTHESAGAPPFGEAFRQYWEGCVYENEYAKVDGVWKITVLNLQQQWHADYETGWARTRPGFLPLSEEGRTLFPEDPHGPDAIDTEHRQVLWPETTVVPFHYPHPVTKEPFTPLPPAQKPTKR